MAATSVKLDLLRTSLADEVGKHAYDSSRLFLDIIRAGIYSMSDLFLAQRASKTCTKKITCLFDWSHGRYSCPD